MTDSPDFALMQGIRSRWQTDISAAVSGTAIPDAFLAALIGNESGGDATVSRFEPSVLEKLWSVIVGRRGNYGAISPSELKNYVAGFSATPISAPTTLPANVFQRLDELAHSWGLTQIMGYHILEWVSIPAWYRTVDDLRQPGPNLKCAALLLTQFANAFTLDLGADFSALLHCWNAGSPEAATFDPKYVPNAMHRMDLYRSLASGE